VPTSQSECFADLEANPVVAKLVGVLRELECELTSDVPAADIAAMRRRFKLQYDAEIDYEREAKVFAGAFLVRNFLRSLMALNMSEPILQPMCIDLGAGSGSSAVALLAYISTRQNLPDSFAINLVDSSSKQLSIAQEVLSRTLSLLPELQVEINYINSSINEYANSGAASGPIFIISSHTAIENRHDLRALHASLTDLSPPGSSVLLVERFSEVIVNSLPNSH
jgi:hypothetical protein